MSIKKVSTTLVLLLIILTYSCNDNSTNSTDVQTNAEKYSYVGEQHNKALAYVYSSLKDHKKSLNAGTSEKSIKELLNKSISEYMDKNFAQFKSSNVSMGIDLGYEGKTFSANSNYNAAIKKADLTSQQEELVADIKRVIYQESDAADLKAELKQINGEASNTLSEEDARVIYFGTSVAYHSTKYWNEHYDEWQELISSSSAKSGDGEDMPEMKFDWSELGASDAGGAVAGATTSAITGCAELTLGACAGVGAVGGGVGASAGNAVYQLLE